ncbi:MAG TPA: aldo/keto reductase [Patescibacteria group bacterium]|nr:aldo/keto reductase [Patescibacteria group bacterium]
MNQRNLGKSGLKVSLVGLGCNNFARRIDLETTRKVVYKALDLGITLFDTADIYGNRGGSEDFLGKVLGDRRKDVVLATKYSGPMDDAGTMNGASRRYIMMAVEASLRRLQTDWIDLYQQHWPDPATPVEESLRALDDLVRQGKVRYIGSSNFAAWQVVDAHWTSRQDHIHSFISCQNEYSLLARQAERELAPAIDALGLGLLPYFPLASGLLTGKYRRGEAPAKNSRFGAWPQLAERYSSDANWQIVENLRQFCAARNHTLLELAFSWLAGRPHVSSVIAGATSPDQVEQNAQAIGWPLGPDDLAEIDRITERA